MVQRIFKVQRSQTSQNGWEIEDTSSGTILDLPDVVLEDLDEGAKYVKNVQMLEKIDTMQIALAGVTDSLRIVDDYSFRNRSVLKTLMTQLTTQLMDSLRV